MTNEQYRKERGLKQINMNVPIDAAMEVWRNRWHHAEIYMLGLQAKKDNPQIITRMREAEEKIVKLANTLKFVVEKNIILEEQISRMQAERGA